MKIKRRGKCLFHNCNCSCFDKNIILENRHSDKAPKCKKCEHADIWHCLHRIDSSIFESTRLPATKPEYSTTAVKYCDCLDNLPA